MKSLIFAAALLGASGAAMAQVSAHIEFGQPGYYGAIDIGDYRPRLYSAQPIIVERRVHYVAEPIYLRVPPGHRKHWSKHCYQYDACDRRVYFVRDDWYENTYVPRYRESRGYAPQPVRQVVERRVIERRYDDDRRYERDDDDDRGGHGHGHGKDHGGGHGKGHGGGHGHGKGH